MEYYEVIFSSSEIKTVQDYLLSPGCPVKLAEGVSLQNKREVLNKQSKDFLSWTKDGVVTNELQIRLTYNAKESKDYENVHSGSLLLKPGVRFVIPMEKCDRSSLSTQGFTLTSTDEATFKAYELAKLEADIGYVKIDNPLTPSVSSGSLKQYFPEITVWIWCRALSNSSPIPQDTTPFLDKMQGEIFDLTPFIERGQTSVTKNGGNFQLSLPPLVTEYDSDGKWVLKKASIQKSLDKVTGVTEYLSHADLFTLNQAKNRLERNQFLFHNIISSNDLVFIRFETLEMEADVRYQDKNNFFVNKGILGGKIYDMIGLVDSNTLVFDSRSNSVTVQVDGRDLSKLFIEDGTYFYALENSQGKLNFLGDSSAKNPLLKRLFFEGQSQMQFIDLYSFKSIETVLKFVIQQLSNIGVVPDSLFNSYGDRRNTSFVLSDKGKDDLAKKQTLINNYQTQVTTEIGRLRKQYGLVSLLNGKIDTLGERETIKSIFSSLKDFFVSIRQQNGQGNIPRIVSVNKTVGWSVFSYKQETIPPNTFPIAFNDQIYPSTNRTVVLNNDLTNLVSYFDILLDSERTLSTTADSSEVLATGIWQIVNLTIDNAVANRRIVDSSISSANGSLLNFIKKICQEPFVEYYMDTYSDSFNLIIRRPPFNEEGITTLLEGKVRNQYTGETVNAPVIDVNEIDVISESLGFNDSEVYSWYRLTPQSSFTGNNSIYSTAYLPALYFPEYAEIWGSKPLELIHNYFPYIPLDQGNKSDNILLKQCFVDLAFIVESYAYLPFTRKGTIVMNGDRRIKVGNLIRYNPSGEIFLVDAVSQSYVINEGTIDRTTTVQVSRGMIEQLIYGVEMDLGDGRTKTVSYFNIIDTSLDFSKTKKIPKTKQVRVKNPDYNPISNLPDNTDESLFDEPELLTSVSTDDNPSILVNKLSNFITSEIKKLAPETQTSFTQFLLQVQSLGYKIIFNNGIRSYAEQLDQFNSNPAQYGNKIPSANAPHVRGYAIDINIVNSQGFIYLKSSSKNDWEKTGVPALARRQGFKWGGDFALADCVHFQYAGVTNQPVDNNGQTEYTYQDVESGTEEVPDEDQILKNFRVDRDRFAFFLRKEQIKYAHPNYVSKFSQQQVDTFTKSKPR
jgi:hypothetical protein